MMHGKSSLHLEKPEFSDCLQCLVCPSLYATVRPRQLGIHGANHNQPWRLVTTSRCSWSRDDEPWQDRPGGDRRHS